MFWPRIGSNCQTFCSTLAKNLSNSPDHLKTLPREYGASQSKHIYDDIVLLKASIRIWICGKKCHYQSGYILGILLCANYIWDHLAKTELASKDFLNVALALEQVYQIKYNNLISPVSFLANLMIFVKTGSHTAIEISCACDPGGSYTSILKWLKDQGGNANSFPGGFLVNVFDN